jgi:hypothetical protein
MHTYTYAHTHQRDVRQMITEKLQAQAHALDKDSKAMEATIPENPEWDKSLQPYIQLREKVHFKQEILERLRIQK